MHRVFGFAGWSGSGKTTLVEQLIARFAAQGVRVALIKHAHHGFDIDQPGKDSFRHREAGATEVLVSSPIRWALMHELRGAPELSLPEAVAKFGACDLVLVEGYKREPIPKLEVWRAAVGKPPLYPDDPHIVGLASDDPLPDAAAREPALRRYGLSDIGGIAEFVLRHAAALQP